MIMNNDFVSHEGLEQPVREMEVTQADPQLPPSEGLQFVHLVASGMTSTPCFGDIKLISIH